jgi:cell division protein ZapA
MNELIAISALIGDRTYRIKLEPGDEEIVRKRLKTINDKIVEFKTQFAGKDMQDYIAMVLIWFATEQTDTVAADVEQADLEDQLKAIERLLDSQLSNK